MTQYTDRIPAHPEPHEFTLQAVLDALVDPVRRSITAQLYRAGQHVRCGGLDLPVARSTATHHFNVLRAAGIIRQYYAGTSKMNALRADELNARFPGFLDACVREAAENLSPAG
ncbi:ArsR/SmtB family transcription factor [Streptomyces sp. NPDC006602]|uniref:ArsR/SmtB family transcription factor n=1 Tax=Streptomyces sp. NPDC006602 TaxID=3364751 RepID=UPI003692FD55